jgi:hypothetical protein
MSEANYTKAELYRAAEKAAAAAQRLYGEEGNALDDIGDSINRARGAVNEAVSIALNVIQDIQDSQAAINNALVGTSNASVEEAIAMVEDANVDQHNFVTRLHRIRQELDDIAKGQIVPSVIDKNDDGAKMSVAASRFRQYANTIV